MRVGDDARCGRQFVEGRGRRTRGGAAARGSIAPRGGEQPEPRADVGVRARSIVDSARASRSRADPERTFAPRDPGVRDLPAPASLAVLSRGAHARAEVASPPLGRWGPSSTAQTKTPSFQKVVLETLFPIPGRYLRGWRAKSWPRTRTTWRIDRFIQNWFWVPVASEARDRVRLTVAPCVVTRQIGSAPPLAPWRSRARKSTRLVENPRGRISIEPAWQEEGLRRSPRSPGGRAQPRCAALSTRASPRRTHSPDGRHDALRHFRLPRREAGPPRARRLQGARRAGDSDAADGRQQARGPPLHRRVRRAHARRREVLQVRPNPTLAARARPPDPPARRRATSARVPARSRASFAPAPRARTRPTRQTVPPSG